MDMEVANPFATLSNLTLPVRLYSILVCVHGNIIFFSQDYL